MRRLNRPIRDSCNKCVADEWSRRAFVPELKILCDCFMWQFMSDLEERKKLEAGKAAQAERHKYWFVAGMCWLILGVMGISA